MNRFSEHKEQILRKVKEKRKKRKILLGTLGGFAAAVLVCNLVLFVPYEKGGYPIARYQGSEYYPLMQRIDGMANRRQTNNFNEWISSLKNGGEDWAMSPSPPEEKSSQDGNESYEEVTNNQVEGIIEGDLFKRSSEYLYYVSERPSDKQIVYDEFGKESVVFTEAGYTISTYSIAKRELINEFAVTSAEGEYFTFRESPELFLSEDLRSLTLFTMCRTQNFGRLYTEAIRIDVSNPEEPSILAREYVTGGYVSARMKDGKFLLATAFWFSNPDLSCEEEFLPQCGSRPSELESFPMDEIYLPEKCKSCYYTNLVLLNEDLSVLDRAALFSDSEQMYISADHIFLTNSFENDAAYADRTVGVDTEVYVFSYRDNLLKQEGRAVFKGRIVNRYCMDEYENVFRIVTTSYSSSQSEGWHPECNLYCLNLSNFQKIAAVENFSDPKESVKSVRFEGEKAYVCTAAVESHTSFGKDYSLYEPIITDPVFEFDLSDYQNITWKDTGTISGYSMSLIKFYGDTLLGIGYGNNFNQLKIEVYVTEESSVVPVARYVIDRCRFSEEFKAYFIDAERGLLGLAVESYNERSSFYLILKFNGETFEEAGRMYPPEPEINVGFECDLFRACRIGEEVFVLGRNYALGTNFFDVFPL